MSENLVMVKKKYGGGRKKGEVKNKVIRFINDEDNRDMIRGVIEEGKRNLGEDLWIEGKII